MSAVDEAAPFLPGDDPAGNVELSGSLVDLYYETYGRMVRLAVLLTGSQPAAEDLVHDAFLRVHRHWQRVEHPKAYLRQAVVNACRSSARRVDLERSVQATTPPTIVSLEADEMFDALAALPHRQRAALVLQFYEDLPQSEIAEILGCREGTVASLVHRGLAQLRRVVEP
jgi:RNA polymerase sigma-70 factor (sigma-E family)